MRIAAVLLLSMSLVASACGDDGGTPDRAPTRAPGTAAAATTPAAPPAARATLPGAAASGDAEVQGIVGAIDSSRSTIEINRLQGADVRVIEVSASTRITSARGGTLRLSDLRPSDRIVARGALQGDALAATVIEVSAAVPGGAPGG